jgi:hypothetical protein
LAIKHSTTVTDGVDTYSKAKWEAAHTIEDDSIGEGHLIIVNSRTDGYVLAWSDADGKLKWIANTHAQLHDRSHDVESSSDHAASSKKGLFLKTNPSTGAIEIVAHGLGYGDVGADASGAAALVDPSAIALTIYNPSGTLVVTKAKTDMTNVSTGVYYYEYDLAVDAPVGVWTAKWLATIAGNYKPSVIPFEVQAF